LNAQLHAAKATCDIPKPSALKFVVLIGVVSLFSDMTYEGARSITGPFLALLGASATVVGFVAGLGEMIGYGLRIASGYLTDRTQKYWPIVFVGYGLNLLAVPFLALAGHWEIAAILMVMERMGKAVRTPARDVMLSCASVTMGRGWGFGLHEALDQMHEVCDLENDQAIVLAAEGWHQGVIGIVASRLVERYHLPTVMIAISD